MFRAREPYQWRVRRLVTICLLLAAFPAAARVRAVRPTERTLWIGAHPDDESLVAPILGLDGSPAMLVLTHGERGDCLLPAGCGGDLGALRAAEMTRAAEMFHAHLTLWTFSDVMADVDATWSAEAGSHAELMHRIEAVIAAERPTVIYTFDPNHGSTCHPAHRAVGALVLEAAAQSGIRVVLVETVVTFLSNAFVFQGATPEAQSFDATSTWDYLVRDIETHVSQFTPEQVESLRNTPAGQRRVWVASVPAQTDSCGK
jgi:LmbE family N-acetylglucosaminyl deacetylase